MKWNNLPSYIKTWIIGLCIPLLIIPFFVFTDYLFPCVIQLSVSCDMENKYSFIASMNTIIEFISLGQGGLIYDVIKPYIGEFSWFSLYTTEILQILVMWFSLGLLYWLTQRLPWYLNKIFKVIMLLVIALIVFAIIGIIYLVITFW